MLAALTSNFSDTEHCIWLYSTTSWTDDALSGVEASSTACLKRYGRVAWGTHEEEMEKEKQGQEETEYPTQT